MNNIWSLLACALLAGFTPQGIARDPETVSVKPEVLKHSKEATTP